MHRSNPHLYIFDNLVGAGEYGRRNFKSERLGGLKAGGQR
jgi:hypothetical protein